MTESISVVQARKLVLLSQKLTHNNIEGRSIDATLAALEHLGYVQIDTISVVERAHHHTLWSRNSRYKKQELDELIILGKAFEYWSHAAAYLPMRDYRFSLPRKHAMKNGTLKHWYPRNDALIDHVLTRIKEEGSLMAKDFDYTLECYVPEVKRQYGYFSLPILWDGRLTARVDCKVNRVTGTLNIKHLVVEPWLTKIEAFAHAFRRELQGFMVFNQCQRLKVHRARPKFLKEILESMTELNPKIN
ncbi:DNA glycosylase AlkZ-like family protein [Agaribacter flavus]|uniref:DNA glycosylase AlkZ-like family protein n=1 Tax=Agaribacter flavus TaxID=1902781 RepID=A0ABV7FM17_9ALTE